MGWAGEVRLLRCTVTSCPNLETHDMDGPGRVFRGCKAMKVPVRDVRNLTANESAQI